MVRIGNGPSQVLTDAGLGTVRQLTEKPQAAKGAAQKYESKIATQGYGSSGDSEGKDVSKTAEGIHQDCAQWSGIPLEDCWQEQAVHMLEQLKQKYSGVTFHVVDGKDAGDTAELAVSAGGGTHLYLTREFLERMGNSREEFGHCYSILAATAGRLWADRDKAGASGALLEKDQVVYWSVPGKTEPKDRMPAAGGGQKDFGSAYEEFRMTATIPLNVSSHFSRMARASSKMQVKEVMGDVHRSMAKLRMSSIFGDSDQQVKASRAIRSLQKLLGRGGRKLRRLDREQLKQQEEKKAEKHHKEEQAQRLRLERKRMRSARIGADCALAKEGRADEAYIRAYRRNRGLTVADRMQQFQGDMAQIFQPGAIGDASMTGGAGAGFSAGDVVVSGPVAF